MLKNNLFYFKVFNLLLFFLVLALNFKTIFLLQLVYFKLYFIIINCVVLIIIMFLIKVLYKFIYWFENKLNYNLIFFLILISFSVMFCILSKYHLFYSLNELYLLNNYEEFINGFIKYFIFTINFITNFFKFNYLILPILIYFFYQFIFLIKIFNILYIKYSLIKNNKIFFNIFNISKNI
jgi:hypothetical protein